MKKVENIAIRIPAMLLLAILFLPSAIGSDKDKVKDKEKTTPTALNQYSSDPLMPVEFGIRYMPTFSSVDIRTSDGGVIEGSAKLSHGFGVMLGINFSNHIGVQGEVNYYRLNQKYRDQSLSNRVEISYLNIPILLSVNTNKSRAVNLNLVAGPQFGINVGSKLKTSGGTGNVEAVAAVKKGDIGFAYGAGLEFALNSDHTLRLDLGYRGFYGFVDMDSNSNDGSYNVIVKATRKTNAAYAGLTFLF